VALVCALAFRFYHTRDYSGGLGLFVPRGVRVSSEAAALAYGSMIPQHGVLLAKVKVASGGLLSLLV
jgi:hypothetical protein